MSGSNLTYYEILEVDINASQEEIKRKYRLLIQIFHPDKRSGEKPEITNYLDTKLKAINQAYETLGDPVKRSRYDQILAQKYGQNTSGKASQSSGYNGYTNKNWENYGKNEKSNAKHSYTVGSTIHFGKYDWQIFDVKDEKALLIAQDVTHVNMAYNKDRVDVTWETCTLRQWLNNDFYHSFSREEQSWIVMTTNRNVNNQWFGTNGGNNTQDKIFLLSLAELVHYFGDSGQLKNRNPNSKYCIDDKYNQKRIAKYIDIAAWWWLRSPGVSSYSAALVIDDGYVDLSGYYVYRVDGGVRPALWLNL